MVMKRVVKDVFLDIIEEWDTYWKDSIEFYDFVNNYVELNDDLKSYVVKKKKKQIEAEE